MASCFKSYLCYKFDWPEMMHVYRILLVIVSAEETL